MGRGLAVLSSQEIKDMSAHAVCQKCGGFDPCCLVSERIVFFVIKIKRGPVRRKARDTFELLVARWLLACEFKLSIGQFEHAQQHGCTTTHRAFSPLPSPSSHISLPRQHGNIGLVHNPPAVNVNHLLIGPLNRWKIATGKLYFHKKDMVIPPTHGATRAQRPTNGGIE